MGSTNRVPEMTAAFDLEIQGIFSAPRETVFRTWTEAEHAQYWWAPRHFVVTSCEIDLRIGGAWRARIESPNWGAMWIGGTYLDIAEPERLVFTFAADDMYGNPGPETVVSVTFTDLGSSTLISFRQGPFDGVENRDGHLDGWISAFDGLASYLTAFALPFAA